MSVNNEIKWQISNPSHTRSLLNLIPNFEPHNATRWVIMHIVTQRGHSDRLISDPSQVVVQFLEGGGGYIFVAHIRTYIFEFYYCF
jgi:hypothetical protein